MKREIPLSVPNLDAEIVDYLRECIQTGWVSTGGGFISEFEKRMADYIGMEETVSMQSGTAALHLSLRILGIQPGDEVIVPTLTFIAAVNPVAYAGAHPVFMDCDEFFCMDCGKLERFLAEECQSTEDGLRNKTTGRKVSAIIPVHVFGNLCDMERIMALAETYGLKVLEDATEAVGSRWEEGAYAGRYGGTVGDMGVYSFNANKIITTGGGGMILSSRKEYLDRARYLGLQAKNDSLHFVHDQIGYNYRMLNLQAALGVSQIGRLEDFIKVKQRNYRLYQSLLKDVKGLRLLPFGGGRPNCWFYALLVEEEAFGLSRDELMNRLIRKGIQCRPVWKLIHSQKPYEGCQAYRIEQAAFYEKNVLNIPCSTNLTEEDAEWVVSAIKMK